jgi:hypothetical protein
MSSIDWKLLDQPTFDRVVEAFFEAENRDIPDNAYAVNGRGGDDGIDIHIRRDGKLTIVQLKCFPEGFSNGFRPRRQQILDSFKSALQHDPDEWHLVVPTTLTNDERRYVVGLPSRQRPKLTKPDVRIVDQAGLDGLASRHLNLVTYFKRDELRAAAKDYNAETALLMSRDDVIKRVSALAKQSDTLHPHWGLDVFTKGDLVGTVLVAKDPRAAELSPVTLTLNTMFGRDHEHLRQSFEQHVGFGTPGRVSLPPAVVSSFTVDGPEFLAKRSENVEIELWTEGPDQESLPVALVFLGEGDDVLASFVGKSTWRNAAARGASLNVVFHDSVTLEYLLPFDQTQQVTMRIQIALGGATPADVVAGIELLEFIESAGAMGIEIDGHHLARLETNGQPSSPFGDNREQILRHRDVAADLIVIQNATRRRFPYPNNVDLDELVNVRFLRLLIEGQCVVIPDQRQVNPILNGQDSDVLRQVLSGDDVALAIDVENYGQTIFGRAVHVGHVQIYAPQVHAVDAKAALAALDAGTADGHQVTLQARDGHGFWAYMPERYADPDDVLRPVGLGIEDYADAQDVARALEAKADMPALESRS